MLLTKFPVFVIAGEFLIIFRALVLVWISPLHLVAPHTVSCDLHMLVQAVFCFGRKQNSPPHPWTRSRRYKRCCLRVFTCQRVKSSLHVLITHFLAICEALSRATLVRPRPGWVSSWLYGDLLLVAHLFTLKPPLNRTCRLQAISRQAFHKLHFLKRFTRQFSPHQPLYTHIKGVYILKSLSVTIV